MAMGHIHKPQVLIPNKIIYAGALEPIDKNDTGEHGYVRGIITSHGVRTEFIPAAKRSYIHQDIWIDETVTNSNLKDLIRGKIQELGLENIYKFILKGYRQADIVFELEGAKNFGNIIEILDETKPALDLKRIQERNQENLLGRFIESFQGYEEESVEYEALCEGVQALLDTRRG